MTHPQRTLDDPRSLRAVAHPVRLGILEQLTIHGPMTATELADQLDETPSNCSWHLRKLAEHSFVEEAEGGVGRKRPWQIVSVGMQSGDSSTSPHCMPTLTICQGRFRPTPPSASSTKLCSASLRRCHEQFDGVSSS